MSISPVVKNAFDFEGREMQGFDLETLVPIARIREHIKADDVQFITDEQLSLYRKAAVESAEHYTGFFIGKRKPVTESISVPNSKRRRARYTFTTKYPIMDSYYHLMGTLDGRDGPVEVEKGTRKVSVQISSESIEGSCCRPCGTGTNIGVKIHYYTGFSTCEDIPAGVILGILKYIAWAQANPGDELLSVQNDFKSRGSTLQGTNNIAWASGALELWRQYNRDAF